MNRLTLIRLSGFAGLLGALGWIVGDILIVGHIANPADYPLLTAYANQLDAELALRLVGVPTSQLMAGALFAVFTMPLYLIGAWHLWQGILGAGRFWSTPAALLMFIGYALSPLPHAAFYFLGATYQSILNTPVAAHPQLLAQAAEFRQALNITFMPAVACQMLGLLWFSAAVATGRSAYPRWFAVAANPLVLGLLTIGVPHLMTGTIAVWLGSAGFNTTWLLVYGFSLCLLWREKAVK